jgi:hypothetical protein
MAATKAAAGERKESIMINADTSIPGVLDISEQFDLSDELPEIDPEYGRLEPARPSRSQRLGERGMVTAEWAIGIVTAVSIAGIVLLFLVKGGGKDLIVNIILNIVHAVSGWGLKGK